MKIFWDWILYRNRLHYDNETQPLKFLDTPSKALFTMKKTTIPALSEAVIYARSFESFNGTTNYVADICAPSTPLILGPSSLVTLTQAIIVQCGCKIVHPMRSPLKKVTLWASSKPKIWTPYHLMTNASQPFANKSTIDY